MRKDDKQIYIRYKNIVFESDENQQSFQTKANKMSPEELHNFKALLLDCRRELAQRSLYLYRVLDHLQVVPTYSIDTMAVDSKNNIYINPSFSFELEARSKSLVTGVLAHEVLHHENRTFSRQGWRDGELWNITTDFVMNRDLDIDGFLLPEEGCIPIKRNNRYYVRTKKPYFTVEEDIDITDITCEFLYNRLDERVDHSNKKEDEGKQGQATTITIEGNHGDIKGTFDKHIKGEIQIVPATEDSNLQPNTGDSKELEKELIKAKEQAHIEVEIELNKDTFVDNAKSGNMQIGRKLERQEALKRGGINWQSVLRDNLVKSIENTTRTYSRLNKRALGSGYMAPGTKQDSEKPEITIAVDSSGSISNKTLKRFIEEVLTITRIYDDYSIQVLVYNDNVVDDFMITPDTRQKVINKIKQPNWKSGGNNETCIKQWLSSKGVKKLDLFILFTDGGVDGSATLPVASKTLFMVTKGNPTYILKKLNPTAPIIWVDLPNYR